MSSMPVLSKGSKAYAGSPFLGSAACSRVYAVDSTQHEESDAREPSARNMS